MAARGSAGAVAACWPRIAVSATVAEPSITTKPAMPIRRHLGDRAGHQDRDADEEDHAGEDGPAAGRAAQRGAAQGGGELRVLLDEGALHLLEQSQLLFGEWHRFLPSGPDARIRTTSGREQV